MDIAKLSPPGGLPNISQWQPLIDAAIASPGEWVSTEVPAEAGMNLQSSIQRLVGKALADVTIKRGIAYVRVHD